MKNIIRLGAFLVVSQFATAMSPIAPPQIIMTCKQIGVPFWQAPVRAFFYGYSGGVSFWADDVQSLRIHKGKKSIAISREVEIIHNDDGIIGSAAYLSAYDADQAQSLELREWPSIDAKAGRWTLKITDAENYMEIYKLKCDYPFGSKSPDEQL